MKVLIPSIYDQGIRFSSFGSALGSKKVDNETLCAQGYPGSPEDIVRQTGILNRCHVASETSLDLARVACLDAMRNANVHPGDIEQVIVSSSSPISLIPTLGSQLHRELECPEIPAHTISASCSGFLFGCDIAARSILTGLSSALVCATETRSKQIDIAEPKTAALFGDGAGASVIASCEVNHGILGICIGSRHSKQDSIVLTSEPGATLEMIDGLRIYFEAVQGMASIGDQLLQSLGLSWNDVELVIPHQANARIVERFCWLTGVPRQKVFLNIEHVGNTSSASIPIATKEALQTGNIRPGDLVLQLGVGAGQTGGAILFRADEQLVALHSL